MSKRFQRDARNLRVFLSEDVKIDAISTVVGLAWLARAPAELKHIKDWARWEVKHGINT